MKRIFSALIGILLLCSGQQCVNTRLYWSPDGSYLAVTNEQRLFLSDADGRLLDSSVAGARLVAWLPDGRRFVLVRGQPARTWEAAKAGIAADRQKELIQLADRLREDLLAHQGDWSKFKSGIDELVSNGELVALILYVRDHRSEGLPEKIGTQRWNDLKKLSVALQIVQVYEIVDNRPEPRHVLATRIDNIAELRLSPEAKAIAIVETGVDDDTGRLLVSPVDRGDWRIVARGVAVWPDWSADGRFLVYATCGESRSGGTIQLGTLTRREVCGASGQLMERFSDPEDLAGLLFFPQIKVRCLRDGRILFSSVEVTLPSTQRDMPQRASLFAIDPDRQPGVTRLIPREAEVLVPNGIELGLFEISPDESRVAIVGSQKEDTGVVVLTLAAGEVRRVLDAGELEAHVPAWRSARELTYLTPPDSQPGAPGKKAVVLHPLDAQPRCLSCDWPALEVKREEEQAGDGK